MQLLSVATLAALAAIHGPAPRALARASPRALVRASSPLSPPVETARATGLALRLDDGTRKAHSMAENTQFVTGFFKGIGTRAAFGQLVASLWFVYEAMEDEFTRADDPAVRALDVAALRRCGPLEADMAFFHGPRWRETVQPSAATRLYVARVREVARASPRLLVGHMYTRYLGDLFGGQMMGAMARRSLGLDGSEGTAFYSFEEIAEPKVFIEGWYARLNALGLDEAEQAAVVAEANRVFSLNIALFDELDGSPLRALWALAVRALAESDARFAEAAAA
jgi:heme oxygenase